MAEKTLEKTAENQIAASGFASGFQGPDRPLWEDYSRCVQCGLCSNHCPTYRELGLEMDSPRGRIYQMVAVDEGRLELGESFVRHIDLCLDCRSCETACPSGVEYGKLVEAARAQIEQHYKRPWVERLLRHLAFRRLFPSPTALKITGLLLHAYQASGLQQMVRQSGLLDQIPRLADLDRLTPEAEWPNFFPQLGRTFPARGEKRFRVALHSGCIANISFARLHEATIRVLQANGCEVVAPAGQICCGALHVHAGRREEARELARRNIAAFEKEPVYAILTNAAGCGSTLKEYDELLRDDPAWAARAGKFTERMKDATEFLAGAGLTQSLRALPARVTYQDSCHLLHGQKVRDAPRKLLRAIPDLDLVEMAHSDICCGSAGIYNVLETELSMQLLGSKMECANGSGAAVIATANPGCLLQLRAGVEQFGGGQRVVHVLELLDEARTES